MPVRGVRCAPTVTEKTKGPTLEATSARVLLHLKTDKGQHDIHHRYPLGAARIQRGPVGTQSVAR